VKAYKPQRKQRTDEHVRERVAADAYDANAASVSAD
jgi:hypothetical protein